MGVSWCDGLQRLVIELELPFEGPIGHAAPLAQQRRSPDPRPRQSPPRLLPVCCGVCVRMSALIIA